MTPELMVPIACTIVMALIGFSVSQALGRVTDNNKAMHTQAMAAITAVHAQISKHEIECDRINKEVLRNRVRALEAEVAYSLNVIHWMNNIVVQVSLKAGGDIKIPPRPERRPVPESGESE